MPARVCPDCREPWPSGVDWAVCPLCGIATRLIGTVASMTPQAAKTVVESVREFEAEWDAAEAISARSRLDVADILVARRSRQDAA